MTAGVDKNEEPKLYKQGKQYNFLPFHQYEHGILIKKGGGEEG